MAVLSGCHVVQGYVADGERPEIMTGINWSQTLATATTSTQGAKSDVNLGRPMYHIISAVNGWVAFGTAPDSSTDPRFFILANTPFDIYTKGGYKVKFTADA